MLTTFLILFTGIITFSAQAQQTDRPFSIELNAGGGLIGNSTTNTAFQPEIGLSYMPGSWGVGVNAGIYSFDSDFSASQYQTGYEQFTLTEVNEDRWSSFFINAGPRFQKSLSRLVQFNLGLDLALSQQKAPSQSVNFYDSSGELESSGVDTDLVLADMNSGDDASGWSAAVRPQVQLEFTPGFSDRFSFNVKTGIQHHLSDREITYTERDLSRVMQVDNPFEMYSQFEQAPVVQRTESAPKTNIFANAGIKIRFGGSRAPAQDYNSSRSNKPTSRAADVGDGDLDSDDDGIEDGVETAKDYNSSRSNKPRSIAPPDDVVVVKTEGLEAADNFVDDIIEALDRCDDGVCEQVRVNADGRKDTFQRVREGELSQDEGIEQVHSIIMEDVASLDKCEADVCRDVLTKEVQLLEHMNVLMSLVQSGRAAGGKDYNSSRSNKPSTIADGVGDGDEDSDDDGIEDAVETAKDYNSSRSNKPSTVAADVDGGGSGLQVVYITKDERGKVYAWGQRPEAKSQDGSGKVYSWGRVPDVSSDAGNTVVNDDGEICIRDRDKNEIICKSTHLSIGDEDDVPDNSLTDYTIDGDMLIVQSQSDDEGKVYSWGRLSLNSNSVCCSENAGTELPEAAAETGTDDEEGRVYSWGIAPRVNTQGDDGLVYAWGVVSRASIQNGNGKVYSWGQNFNVNNDSCEGGICPQPDNALYLAKELGLAAAGNDIEIIKEALDRCDDGVCEQVRLNADKRHEGVRRALENPSGMDSEIEEILSIVREDIESLGKCDTDVCRDVLAMEEDLLVKMNRLNDMEQVAPAQDYNSSRSNKPTSIAADVNDCDDDDDCVRPDDAVETAQDYNSSRSNKPRTEDGRGGNDGNSREIRFARLANPAGLIVRTGMVAAGGKKGYDYYLATQKSNNPLYEGGTSTGENPVYEGQANDGDSDNNDNQEPVSVQRFELQPGSYCVALSTMKISTNSQQAMRSGAQNPKPDMDEDGFPEMMKSASFSISKRSARTGRNPSGDEDMDSDGDGIHFDLEIDPIDEDSDNDGVLDGIETASYSISKRSARTGRNTDGELETMESKEGVDPNTTQMSETEPADDVYQWSYNLNELEGVSDLPTGGTLTVLFTGGEWHFDLEVDPLDLDDDGDGLAELLQNSSFSISKRSARM